MRFSHSGSLSFIRKILERVKEIMAERIKEHPILGVQEKGRPVTFTFDGKELQGFEGEPIAVALKANGVMAA